jgi:hypothetical protein
MHEVFYEEASARQEAINRALTRNSSAMSTREAKWKPLLHSVNVRFAAMGAPTINFDQLIQKISNTKKKLNVGSDRKPRLCLLRY